MEDFLRVEDVTRAFSQFGARDVARGRAYFAQRRVVTTVERSVESDGLVLYTASVRGSSPTPYTTYLIFNESTRRLVSAECTCPLCGDCKHCVATLEALERQIGDPRTATRAASSPVSRYSRPIAPAARVQLRVAPEDPLDRMTQGWVHALELTAAGPRLSTVLTPTPLVERLLFLVSCPDLDAGGSRIHVGVFRACVEADGSYGSRRILNHSTVDWARDPAVSPGDHALVVKLGAFSMGYAPIRGEVGARVFADVVATGRAFLEGGGEEGSGDLPLVGGGAKRGTLTFIADSQGAQQPSLAVEGIVDARLLLLWPPFYIDRASGATGPVDVPGASDALVHTWLTGVRFPPDAAAAVARHLAKARLPFRPPAPRVRTIRRVDVAPTLIVRLESQMAARRPDRYGQAERDQWLLSRIGVAPLQMRPRVGAAGDAREAVTA